nr:MAG TPA: hypothetical protein [Caudoviricetes sp.]
MLLEPRRVYIYILRGHNQCVYDWQSAKRS